MRWPALALLALIPLSLAIILAACWQWGSNDFVFDNGINVYVGTTPAPAVSTAVPSTPTPAATALLSTTLEIDPPRIGQGGSTVVRIRSAGSTSLTASFAGKPLPLAFSSGPPGTQGPTAWAVIGIAPDHPTGDFPVVVRGTGATELIAVLTVTRTNWPVDNIQVPPEQTNLLSAEAAQQEQALRTPVLQTFTPERLWSGPFRLPVQAPISDPFGIGRSYNGGPVTSYHTGTDFDAPTGTPVGAAARGRVVYAGPLPIRGNSVIIDHGVGVLSGYHHLSEISVPTGQLLNAGDIVGRVGATGLATGPHLHWEVIIRGVNVDPLLWTERELGP